jgi:hypothetical protein
MVYDNFNRTKTILHLKDISIKIWDMSGKIIEGALKAGVVNNNIYAQDLSTVRAAESKNEKGPKSHKREVVYMPCFFCHSRSSL